MSPNQSKQLDAAAPVEALESPGELLKEARLAQEIGEREAADRLNWMPGYVAIIERDDFEALRAPAFARGYVKAYARLLRIDEERVLAAFDRLRRERAPGVPVRIETHSLQLQHTGLGVVTGLAVLLLLVFALWWFGGKGSSEEGTSSLYPSSLELERNQVAGQASRNDSLAGVR